METVARVELPRGSLAAKFASEKGFDDYADSYAVRVDPARFPDVDSFARAFLRRPPRWIVALLRMRDAVVGVFGLKTTRGGELPFALRVRDEHEMIFGEDDAHLDFRVSFLHEGRRVIVSMPLFTVTE